MMEKQVGGISLTYNSSKRIWRSEKLSQLGSSIFLEVAAWKGEAIKSGLDVIDLGIGSPDQPPALEIRQTLSEAVCRRIAIPTQLPRAVLHSSKRHQLG